jgi:hypothetical protein
LFTSNLKKYRVYKSIIQLSQESSSSSNDIEVAITAGVAIGVGVILAKVAQNFINQPGFGLGYDFASDSQQKQDEQQQKELQQIMKKDISKTHSKGPGEQIGILTPGKKKDRADIYYIPDDQQVGGPNKHLCTGLCKKNSCDSQGFCLDSGCLSVIRGDSQCKPTSTRKEKTHTPDRTNRPSKTPSYIPIPVPVMPSQIPGGGGGDQTLTDNQNQSVIPPDTNQEQNQLPDDSSSQEQPIPSLIQQAQAQTPTTTTSSKRQQQQQTPTIPQTVPGRSPTSTTTPQTVTGIPTIGTSPTPVVSTGPKDVFKITKIYDDGAGSNWTMNMNNPMGDGRSNNPEASGNLPKFSKNSDGSWKVTGNTKGVNEIRWAIAQTNGFKENTLSTCTPTVKARGYMQDASDWKDIEMSAYYKINKLTSSTQNGEAHIEHVMRGQRSTNEKGDYGGCDKACANNYHGNAYPRTGRQKYEKDFYHKNYTAHDDPHNDKATSPWPIGQWIGYKTICMNTTNGVHLETWTDIAGNGSWQKTLSYDDTGTWQGGGNISLCKGSGRPPISWGGPLCAFRSDNISDYDIKWASIRSINSSKPLVTGGYAYPGYSRRMLYQGPLGYIPSSPHPLIRYNI